MTFMSRLYGACCLVRFIRCTLVGERGKKTSLFTFKNTSLFSFVVVSHFSLICIYTVSHTQRDFLTLLPFSLFSWCFYTRRSALLSMPRVLALCQLSTLWGFEKLPQKLEEGESLRDVSSLRGLEKKNPPPLSFARSVKRMSFASDPRERSVVKDDFHRTRELPLTRACDDIFDSI